MVEALELKKTDKVLEIGTGTGYQTAILSNLCQEVFTIEVHDNLIKKAKKRIAKLNLKNIIFKLGNGAKGWQNQNKALFDAIIISAASEIIPAKLLENLKNQGSLVMPKKKTIRKSKTAISKKK
mgnify:CR=1 FL=1